MIRSIRYRREFLAQWAELQNGRCVSNFCYWMRADPETLDWRCTLADDCGPICTRHPLFRGSGDLPTGHRAGFDFFMTAWCYDAEWQLPKGEIRDFWFPPEYDQKVKRRARFQRRKSRQRRKRARPHCR